MKKLLSLLLALTMILPLVGCAAFAENADPIMITVIATSDVHGKVLPINYATGEPSPNVGLSMIASMIEQVRATERRRSGGWRRYRAGLCHDLLLLLLRS